MNALLYRPGPKRPVFVAFAAAAAIHISAFAFLPNHRTDHFIADDFSSYVDGENADPGPTPEPEQQQTETDVDVRPPVIENDFYEDVKPTPRRFVKPAGPIRANQTVSALQGRPGNGKLFAISAPRPNYPYEARSHHITGSGAVMLEVDPVTGTVIKCAGFRNNRQRDSG
jgi:hypothetical protein